MMVAIGHSSPGFCHDDPVETLKRCADAGFDVWEIVGDGRHFLPDARHALGEASPSYDVTLQLHAPIADVNIGSLNPRAWELSVATHEDSMRAAAQLGIENVTVHPGNHSPLSRGHYDKVHAATRRALQRLDAVAEEVGLSPNLENVPRNWAFETDRVDLLADLVEGTSFGLTLDLGHAHVAGHWDEFFDVVDRIRNVHIHDNQGDNDDHLTLDEGTVPWREAVRRLRAGGYRGTFVVESRSHASGAESRRLLKAALARGA